MFQLPERIARDWFGEKDHAVLKVPEPQKPEYDCGYVPFEDEEPSICRYDVTDIGTEVVVCPTLPTEKENQTLALFE